MQYPGHAVLQLPVPALEDFVRSRTDHYDPGFLGTSDVADTDFVHAHITVLAPFASLPDLALVAEGLFGTAPFEVTLGTAELFPNGLVHSRPEPEDALRALTARMCTLFPDVVPYGGLHRPVPHLTLDALGPGVSLASVREWTSRVLPCSSRIEAVDLVWYESGNTRLCHRWWLST
ncbi:hypothetical protein GCM10027030_13460 [Luteococcus sediminum]